MPPSPAITLVDQPEHLYQHEVLEVDCRVETVKPADDMNMWVTTNGVRQNSQMYSKLNSDGKTHFVWTTSFLNITTADVGADLVCVCSWRGKNYTSESKILDVWCKYLICNYNYEVPLTHYSRAI